MPSKRSHTGRPLRVGINGQPLRAGRAGVGHYTFELCRALDRCLPEARFYVYSAGPVDLPVASGRWTLRPDPLPLARRLKPILWLKLRCGALCRGDDLDVFWGTTTFLPGLPGGVRRVITVCDLNYRVVPETMSTAFMWANRLFFARDVRRADTALAISEGTSDRMQKLLGRRASGVIRPSVNERFRPQDEAAVRSVRARYGIEGPYLLALSTWEPRKNFELLVRTFLDMKEQGLLPRHRLVLAGGRGWKDRRLAALVAGSGRGGVLPLGYVPDGDLPPLYAGADLFVFPSLYEGFGMPVLEARACGTRAVASDIPEIREAGGPDTVYIEPTGEGIREGILAALRRPPGPAGEMPKYETWEEGAERLAAALRGEL